jgi:hypothetical protein
LCPLVLLLIIKITQLRIMNNTIVNNIAENSRNTSDDGRFSLRLGMSTA